MKSLITLILAAGLCISCSTTTNTAFKTESVIIPSVDAAMITWHDYVWAGKATQMQVDNVKVVYNFYYAAQQKVKVALENAITTKSTDNELALVNAQRQSESSRQAVIDTVSNIITK